MMLDSLVFSIGIIIQVASRNSWVQFSIGRLVAGLGVGALSGVVPMVSTDTSIL